MAGMGGTICPHPTQQCTGASPAREVRQMTHPASCPDSRQSWLGHQLCHPAGELARHKYSGSHLFSANSVVAVSKTGTESQQAIANVEEAYAKLPLDICRHIWLTAQIVMNSILLSDGGNQYKLPHIGKMRITRALGNKDFLMRLPCQAIIAGANINKAAITAFVAAKEANGKPLCHRTTI